MLSVSAELAAAIESADQQIVTRVWVDWDKDGFGGAGSLDDLSPYVAGVTIGQTLTTELPDAVRLVDGEAAATLSVDLARGDTYDDRRSAAWRFSSVNPDSPYAGKKRKMRPVVVDVGYATGGPNSDADGVEWIRVFRGFTRGLTVSASDGAAQLTGLDYRETMRGSIALPAVNGELVGLNASWLAARAARAAGANPSPAPEPGCRVWVPMDGSLTPAIGSTNDATYLGMYDVGTTINSQPSSLSDPTFRPPFAAGPFVAGFNPPSATTSDVYRGFVSVFPGAGRSLITSDYGQGRHEFWVRRTWDSGITGSQGAVQAVYTAFVLPGVTNQGFEQGTVGWTPDGCTLVQSFEYARSDFASGKMTPNGTAGVARAIADSRSVSASTSYTWTAWVYSPGGYSNVTADIDWLTSAGAFISTSIGATTAVAAGDWVLLSTTATSPSTAGLASGKVSLRGTPPTSAVAYLDDCQFFASGGDTDVVCTLSATVTASGNVVGRMGYPGTTIVETATATVPKDDAWHFVGVHWDLNGGRMKIRIDSAEQTWTGIKPVGAAPGSVEEDGAAVQFAASSDASEYRMTACDWDTPWAADRANDVNAVIDLSRLDLGANYDTEAREIWGLVSEIADAEQAVVYWDSGTADGGEPVFRYRTRSRLTEPEGQTVQRELTAEESLIDLQLSDGIDSMANDVTVRYATARVRNSGVVYSASDSVELHRNSTTTWSVEAQNPILAIPDAQRQLYTDKFGTPPALASYVKIRDHEDGTGTAYDLWVTIDSFDTKSITFRAVNNTNKTLWIVAPSNGTCVQIYGDYADVASSLSVSRTAPESIDEYGDQPLDHSVAQWVQTDGAALGIASALVNELSDPAPTVTDMPIKADPRLSLGDRVSVTDADGTGLSDEYWVSGLNHKITPGGYTQQVTARRAAKVAEWRLNRWGDGSIWA